MQWTEILNPGQTCVLGADQTLYAIIKLIQWQFPDTLGEDKLVVIMGALHIEDKMHLMIGKLLRDTGWATILSQAEVLTSGRAQSTLDEHHIKHTRYARQVSLVSLYMLKQNAYVEYCNNVMGPPESYSMWNERSQTVPQFKFWSMIIELELLMTRCVRPCEKETSHYMYNHATNSAASSTPWTTRSSLHNKILRCMQNS